jgi:hypothetical protein
MLGPAGAASRSQAPVDDKETADEAAASAADAGLSAAELRARLRALRAELRIAKRRIGVLETALRSSSYALGLAPGTSLPGYGASPGLERAGTVAPTAAEAMRAAQEKIMEAERKRLGKGTRAQRPVGLAGLPIPLSPAHTASVASRRGSHARFGSLGSAVPVDGGGGSSTPRIGHGSADFFTFPTALLDSAAATAAAASSSKHGGVGGGFANIYGNPAGSPPSPAVLSSPGAVVVDAANPARPRMPVPLLIRSSSLAGSAAASPASRPAPSPHQLPQQAVSPALAAAARAMASPSMTRSGSIIVLPPPVSAPSPGVKPRNMNLNSVPALTSFPL